MNKTAIAIVALAAIAVLGAGFLIAGRKGSLLNTESLAPRVLNPAEVSPTPQTENTAPVSGTTAETKKDIAIEARNFSFSLSSIRAKRGERVTLILKNTGGFHDLIIDEFGAATRRIRDGEEDTISFVAHKTGVFEYYCSVGNHRAMGMKGTLTVTE